MSRPHEIAPAEQDGGRTTFQKQSKINTQASDYQCVIRALEANVQRQIRLIERLKTLQEVCCER